jgi:molybdate transport system substrate-binding protein
VKSEASPPAAKQELIVFAASSLADVFGDLEQRFEKSNPGVDVVLNLAGSQALRVQIDQGASVDVFVSASDAHMTALQKAGLMGPSKLLAENLLVLVTPEDNPAKLDAFADLPKAKRIVLGAAEVPVGSYTDKLLANTAKTLGPTFEKNVMAHVVSREANVRLVLAKVELGEADAAIVYRTDVETGKVRSIHIPEGLAEKARYPLAISNRARHAELAGRWASYVTGPVGRKVLFKAGFIVPAEQRSAP